MILGLGLDIVELSRIERAWQRWQLHFAKRILAPEESALLPKKYPVPFIAARFAAKEAAVKALGTGFTQGIGLHDIRITSEASGKPILHMYGTALLRLQEIGANSVHLSLTHAKETAAAVVILERIDT